MDDGSSDDQPADARAERRVGSWVRRNLRRFVAWLREPGPPVPYPLVEDDYEDARQW